MSDYRNPIVVILGHVDHGKTSLLDYIRKSHVVDGESGGITQHTRSFKTGDTNPITFIDTPGHAAFAQMRKRAGKIADIAILIVSAVDGVMPQTIESIKTIQDAQIPMIVAINKIDDSKADSIRTKTQLIEQGVLLEGMGGDIPVVEISAKTGQGIDQLLELISLVWSLNPQVKDTTNSVLGYVLESNLDPKKGAVATLIIKQGVLRIGDNLYTDKLVGKVKNLTTTTGIKINDAGPSEPVEILGLNNQPEVGSLIGTAVVTAEHRPQLVFSKDGLVNFILKTDVYGSLEAIVQNLDKQVGLKLIGTGDVTESDVLLAKSTGSQIIAFSVRIPGSVAKLAEIEHVQIKTFSIIYELLEDVQKTLNLRLNPHMGEQKLGTAIIKARFDMNGEVIMGCQCIEGQLTKGDKVRLKSKEAKIKSLRLGKREVEYVKNGQEFGMVLSSKVDFELSDSIMAYLGV
jgi:translation initiation factor IF-2